MAVQLNMSSYRADYFIGDANMSQRVEAQQMSQENSQFAQMLGSRNTGSVNSSGSVKADSAGSSVGAAGSASDAALAPLDAVIKDTVVEKVFNELEKVDASALGQVVEIGGAIPEDTMELARAIVNGDIDIKDVPADKITFELLKALVIARLEKKLKDENDAEDPEEKSKDQTNTTSRIDLQLAILYKLIDAYTEMRYDDNTDTAGVTERIREVAEMLNDKGRSAELTDILAQILNDRIEAASTEENTDVFGRTAEIVKETEDVSPLEELIRDIGKTLGEDYAKVLDDAVKSGDIGEITKAVKQIAEDATKPEAVNASVAKTSVKSAVSEELEMLRNAKLAQAQQNEDEFARFVKTPVKADAEQSDVTAEAVEVAVEAQSTGDSKQDSGTGESAQQGAAMAAVKAPIVFRTEDGAEFEVQPSEVVSQAMNLVEQAVRDTAEQTEYSLVLNPGELGRITVRMIKAADGAVSVTIAAENAHTQRILEENSSLMQSNLRSSGIQLENWQTVSESQQETLAQDYNGSSKNPYYREDAKPEEEPEQSFADIIAAM